MKVDRMYLTELIMRHQWEVRDVLDSTHPDRDACGVYGVLATLVEDEYGMTGRETRRFLDVVTKGV